MVVACLALALSGIAVGVLIGRWTAATPLQASAAPEVRVDLTPILDELRRINPSTLAPTHQTSDASIPAPANREPARQNAEDSDRLAAAIEKLNGLLERSGSISDLGSTALEKWKGPGFQTLDEMFQRVVQIRDATGNGGWISQALNEMRDAHFGWTRQNLLERYGKPSSMLSGDRGLAINYAHERRPGVVDTIGFNCTDGLVADVMIAMAAQ
jgi:hypothetical protein